MEKKIKKFCPKCGSELVEVRANNEDDFFTSSIWTMGEIVNNAGEKYSRVNGKKMYRTEFHCPTKIKKGLFCKKEESHYIILGQTNLTD